MASFARQTVTRERGVPIDDGHGNETVDWSNPDQLVIARCTVQPGASQEVLAGRDATVIRYTVSAPPGVDVLATDRIVFNGATYDIDGEPGVWSSPTGALAHTIILLKTWEG